MNAIYLAAVARGKHQRFFQNAARAKLFRGPLGLLAGERHLFPHLNGCRAEIQANEYDLHAARSALLKVPEFPQDRKTKRLNSSHQTISYPAFSFKQKHP